MSYAPEAPDAPVDGAAPAESSAIGSCTRCNAAIEKGDLRCAVCAFSVPHHAHAPGAEKDTMKVFRCNGCGAATSWSAEKKALACAFCGMDVVLEELEDPPEQTESWLPFVVDEKKARVALTTWLKSRGFFRPGDLASSSTVDNLKPLWWPAWIFDARARVTWTADSNAGSGRSDWAPHSGEGELSFERILIGASRGLSEKEMDALADAYNLGPAVNAPSGAAANVVEEAFDVQRSAARERVANACQTMAMNTVQGGGVIPGSRFRNVHVALVLEDLFTRRVVLPAWVLAYRYKHKLYRVVVAGQNEPRVIGQAPLSLWKIVGVVFAVLGVLAAIGLIVWLTQRPHRAPKAPTRPPSSQVAPATPRPPAPSPPRR